MILLCLLEVLGSDSIVAPFISTSERRACGCFSHRSERMKSDWLLSFSQGMQRAIGAYAHLLHRSLDRWQWRCWRSWEPVVQSVPCSADNDTHT